MILLFILSLCGCIFIHELGHLLAAKLVKCKVLVFSVGFGRPIFQTKIKETTYQIGWLLLGGYNKLKDELICSRSKYAFTNLKYRNKLFITLAGCEVNIFIGLIAWYIGIKFLIFPCFYFGFLSVFLGLFNLLPIPALDGSYIYLVWLEKWMGKKRGYALMSKLCRIGFIFLMTLNIMCIPILIQMLIRLGY